MRRTSAGNELSLEAPESELDLDPPDAQTDGPRRLAATMFEQQHLPVCRYLVSLGLRHQVASDITQESFLRLYRHLRSNGREENLRGWVFRVAHNLAMNELVRAGAAEPETADTRRDPRADPEQTLLDRERMDRLEAAIRTLPRRQQECLHLRAEGLRYREIAQVLGIRISSAAESVQRALDTLARICHE